MSAPTRARRAAPTRPRWLYVLIGLVSTLFGVGLAQLLASLIKPSTSPVQALGTWVVGVGTEGFMAPVKDWAIEQFGDNDKLFLQANVALGVVVLAIVAGLVARRSWQAGAVVLVLMIAAPVLVLVTGPVFGVLDLVPSLVALVAAVAALWWLDGLARRTPTAAAATSGSKPRAVLTDTPGQDARDTVSSEDPAVRTEKDADGAEAKEHAGPSRRGVLIASAALTAVAVVLGGAGRLITAAKAKVQDIALPQPAAGEVPPALPEDLSTRFKGISPLQVPNDDFYRVDTRLDVPVVDADSWTLTVDGDVENEFTITFDELLQMEFVERDITLTCVSNTVGGKYVGAARWLGVPLQTIIDRAKPRDGVDQMMATDFDGMTIGTPYDMLTDGREALLCVGMNGEQLPREHGFPVRVVIPGLYGFISATKWVTRLTFTTYADQESYWTERGWDTRAPIKPSARIDTPRSAQPISGNDLVIGGVAWAQNDGGVSKVQVQLDGGPWTDAMQGPEVNAVYWRQWYYQVPDALEAGSHSVSARVVDGDGQVQTDVRAQPYPGGASGIHTLLFRTE